MLTFCVQRDYDGTWRETTVPLVAATHLWIKNFCMWNHKCCRALTTTVLHPNENGKLSIRDTISRSIPGRDKFKMLSCAFSLFTSSGNWNDAIIIAWEFRREKGAQYVAECTFSYARASCRVTAPMWKKWSGRRRWVQSHFPIKSIEREVINKLEIRHINQHRLVFVSGIVLPVNALHDDMKLLLSPGNNGPDING